MRHQDIWELYESGEFLTFVDAFQDAESLDMFMSAMLENGEDAGVPAHKFRQRIDDVNYEMAI